MRGPREAAPLIKFLAMAFCIATVYILKDLRLVALVIVFEGLVALACGVFRTFCITFVALLIGAFTLCLFQIFTIREGTVLFYLFPFWKRGAITDVGLSACLLLALRMMASVGSIPLMLSVTSQTQVVSLVSGNLRLPGAYAVMLVTALRFIPTFGDRMRLVLQAEAARGYRADTGNPLRKVGMILKLSLPLLISCVRDVDTLALSIETRGFDPRSNIRPRTIPIQSEDITYLLICVLPLLGLIVMDRFII